MPTCTFTELPMSLLTRPSYRMQLGHGKGYYDRYIERYRAFASRRGEKPPLLGTLDTLGNSLNADSFLSYSRSRPEPADSALSVRLKHHGRPADGAGTPASEGARIDRGTGDGRRRVDGLDCDARRDSSASWQGHRAAVSVEPERG